MTLIRMETLLVALAVQAVNTLLFFRSHRALLCSNFALRQQLTVYKRKQRRPSLRNRDRIHDNDGIFGQLGKPVTIDVDGKKVSCRSSLDVWLAETMGIQGIPTPYRAPNANAHIERFNGTLRRELLDHILIWNEHHLRSITAEYTRWYNAGRVHQGIDGIPDPAPDLTREKPATGRFVARPICGGLHHDYRLVA